MLVLLIILLCFIVTSSVREIFGPTDYEIRRALHYQQPNELWGYQARQERNVRVLCIGGSNTKYGTYTIPLNDYLNNATLHPTWFGSVNALGISGSTPYTYIGMKYGFESLPTKKWPNVILLEFAVNSGGYAAEDKAHIYDSVIGNFKFKYKAMNLSMPDFMFFDLFDVSFYLMVRNSTWTHKQRMDHLQPKRFHMTESYHGCLDCPAMHAIAEYYDYPVMSWRKLGYNAFLRYYDATQKISKYTMWKFIKDSVHISPFGGNYIVDTLFKPFFDYAMKPRIEVPNNDIKIRLFPLTPRPLITSMFSTSYGDGNLNIDSLISKPNQWKLLKETGFGHRGDACYGTTNKSATIELNLDISKDCSKSCSVAIGFIHSWNTSRIGNVSCDITRTEPKSEVVVEDYIIQGNEVSPGVLMHFTGLVKTTINATVREGKHVIKCKKLDSSLSCLVSVSVATEVMI